MQHIDIIITVIVAVFGSTGFWSFIQTLQNKQSSEKELLLGIAYERLHFLCSKYIERGWITFEELEDLYKYLYLPYKKCGGNGTGEKLIQEVDALPRRKESNENE